DALHPRGPPGRLRRDRRQRGREGLAHQIARGGHVRRVRPSLAGWLRGRDRRGRARDRGRARGHERSGEQAGRGRLSDPSGSSVDARAPVANNTLVNAPNVDPYVAPFAPGGPIAVDTALAERLLGEALARGGDYAELYFEYRALGD